MKYNHWGRTYAVHLLNDFSGSPLVLREVLRDMQKMGNRITVLTSTEKPTGFLTHGLQVHVARIPYGWSPSKAVTFMRYLWSQLFTFFFLLRSLNRNDSVYVNTLLPFGAMLAGKLKRVQVTVHIHEVSLRPLWLQRFLVFMAKSCASEVVFVSQYTASRFRFSKTPTSVVRNTLPDEFWDKATQHRFTRPQGKFTVLMLASLKAYKGIYEYAGLSRRFPGIRFLLVLNAGLNEAEKFKWQVNAPANLEIHPATSDTHWFYSQAHVVVNLSRPDQWIETFGMTILEAFAYGRPVIAPPVGGPSELVTHGVNGFLIDSRNAGALDAAIKKLWLRNDLYHDMVRHICNESYPHFSHTAHAG
ncbi:MAG: glycosyltransferase family 4 protein [Bacteroidetes bacterium]|nr:glycosyltransferase family 4 protein [Bacteroidota bacterium]